MPIIIVGVVALAVLVALAASRRPSRRDHGVENFRRHIDALSPEARRQVQQRVRGNDDERRS